MKCRKVITMSLEYFLSYFISVSSDAKCLPVKVLILSGALSMSLLISSKHLNIFKQFKQSEKSNLAHLNVLGNRQRDAKLQTTSMSYAKTNLHEKDRLTNGRQLGQGTTYYQWSDGLHHLRRMSVVIFHPHPCPNQAVDGFKCVSYIVEHSTVPMHSV